MFQHDCLDTYCFECLICMCFVFFVFALVQRNWACFTWKGALEVRSLLLLLVVVVVVVVVLLSSLINFELISTSQCLSAKYENER